MNVPDIIRKCYKLVVIEKITMYNLRRVAQEIKIYIN